MVLLEPFCLHSNLFCCWLYICQSCLYSDWSHLGCLELPQSFEPGQEKMCLMSYANNKGADQPAHLCSLISTFVVHCLYSISRFYSQNFKTLASFWAVQASLCLARSETHEDMFCHGVAHFLCSSSSVEFCQCSLYFIFWNLPTACSCLQLILT